MNQYYHELSAYIGLRKCGQGKKLKKIAAGIGMPDSFRAWLDRDGTHYTLGSWWKIEHPEQLKKAKKEEVQKQYYRSPKVRSNCCVDGLTEFFNFVKVNKKLFHDFYKEEYGFPILVHLLQDFYTDIIWRVMYNFEHQEQIILKTEGKVLVGDQDIDGEIVLQPQCPSYHSLATTIEVSKETFREEYNILNEYATYLLMKILEKERIEYGDKQENQIKRSFFSKYPKEIAEQAKRYTIIPKNIMEAFEGNEEERKKIEMQAIRILGGNMHLFKQMNINCIKAVPEAKRLSKHLNQILYHSKKNDQGNSIEKAMEKQMRMKKTIEQYQQRAYHQYEHGISER